MLCIRQRFWQSGPIFIICSVLLVTGFLIQFHVLYTIQQKNHRTAEYKAQMNELYDTMKSVERVANSTATLLHKLRKAVINHKAPHMKQMHKIS